MPNPAPFFLRRAFLPLAWAWIFISCSWVENGGRDGKIKPIVPPTVDPQDKAVSVFHGDSVYHFELTVEDSLWDWLNKHPLEERFVPGNLSAMGMEWKNVGIRYKGAYGSLRLCFDARGNLSCDKLSLKIRFDEYAKDQRFHGLKRLNFNSMVRDPTKLHERLASHLFREAGIPSIRSVHATLSVNGKSLGLFSLVEQIDGRFTDSRFPKSGDGNLYKEVWPQFTDPGRYVAAMETNDKVGDVSPMVRFAKDLKALNAENHESLLTRSVDVGYLLRYLAVDQTITNWDGATTFYCWGDDCNSHNFFWYQDDLSGKLWLIPTDLDATFAFESLFPGQPAWNDLETGCQPFLTLNNTALRPAGCDPLFKSLARDYRDEHRKVVEDFLEGAFNVPRLQGLIDKWSAQIESHLEKDPTRKLSLTHWKNEVSHLKESLEQLKTNARKRIQGLPVNPFGLSLASVSGFEGWLPVEIEGVSFTNTNIKSDATPHVNVTLPLAGSQDFRVDFAIRNDSEDSSGAWKQYLVTSIPFPRRAPTDLRGMQKIQFKAKADPPRFIRLDLLSDRYSNPYLGKFFGWDVKVEVEPGIYTVDLANLSLPSWGIPILDSLPGILPYASGLQWSPHILGRNGVGLFTPGSQDSGFFQIDDIQFIP